MLMRRYDPFDPEVLADPHPWYRWLRDEAPLYHVENRDYWVMTRWGDVHGALRDHGTYSSARGNSPEAGLALSVIGTDPPKHTRLRRIVQVVFTPKNLERRWRPRVQQICRGLVDAALRAGSIDAFRALTLPLPIQIIAEMIGVPDGDLAEFKRWSDDIVEGVSQHLDAEVKRRTEAAFGALARYFAETIARRRHAPAEDLVTLLIEAGDDEKLTDKEIVHFLILLLIAGNETTTNLLGNGLLALARNPEQQALLRARPELMPSAIEEMLRYCPPTQAVFRQTTRAVEVHGVTIPENRRVMLSLASANRDPRQFERADDFVVDRGENDHVAFGSGVHFCLGAPLARMEVGTMLGELLARTRGVRLEAEPKMVSTVVIRGPVVLPLAIERSEP